MGGFRLDVPEIKVHPVKPALKISDFRAKVKAKLVMPPATPAAKKLTVVPVGDHQQKMGLAHSASF